MIMVNKQCELGKYSHYNLGVTKNHRKIALIANYVNEYELFSTN